MNCPQFFSVQCLHQNPNDEVMLIQNGNLCYGRYCQIVQFVCAKYQNKNGIKFVTIFLIENSIQSTTSTCEDVHNFNSIENTPINRKYTLVHTQ